MVSGVAGGPYRWSRPRGSRSPRTPRPPGRSSRCGKRVGELGGAVPVRGTVGTRTGTGTHTRRHTAEGSMRGERGIRPRRVSVCAWEGTGTHLFCTFSAMTALAGGVRLRRAAGLGAVHFRPCVLPWNRGSPVGGSSHAPPATQWQPRFERSVPGDTGGARGRALGPRRLRSSPAQSSRPSRRPRPHSVSSPGRGGAPARMRGAGPRELCRVAATIFAVGPGRVRSGLACGQSPNTLGAPGPVPTARAGRGGGVVGLSSRAPARGLFRG